MSTTDYNNEFEKEILKIQEQSEVVETEAIGTEAVETEIIETESAKTEFVEADTIEATIIETENLNMPLMLPVIMSGGEEARKARRTKSKGNFKRIAAAVIVAAAIGGGSFGLGIGAGINLTNNKANESANTGLNITEDELLALIQSQMVSDTEYIQTATDQNATLSSVSGIFKKVKDSVVSINMTATTTDVFNRSRETSGAGSGIIFKEDSEKIYIVTNYHVIDSATKVTISIDDKNEVSANYVGGDSKADIAVISVNKSELTKMGITNYKVATFGNSDKMEVGDAVIAIGNALGEGKSATFGIISTEQKTIDIDGTTLEVIQTDAAINPGNSGGALVNTAGEVIGINTAKLSSSGVEGMGYAIPINIAKTLVDRIMSTGSIERPYLGLNDWVEITEDIKSYNGLPSVGIYVRSIASNSTAAKAGMKREDIITAINGVTIKTEQELIAAINKIKVGSEFTITVMRTTVTGRNIFGSASSKTSEEIELKAVMQNYSSELSF